MPRHFKAVGIVQHGDAAGNRMVVRLTTQDDLAIHAIAVPQDGDSRTGPTWSYLFENEGVTLIDPGSAGSFSTMVEGIGRCGYQIRDIERVIISHGHADHDGAVAQLVAEAGAEFWAHDVYAYLLPYDPRDIQLRPTSPIKQEMIKVAAHHRIAPPASSLHDRYLQSRRGLEVKHPIQADEKLGGLTFIHAPGHSPDEICITLNGLVFTGDHVLPEISPHPTMKTLYPAEIKQRLPAKYHDEDRSFGLLTYLRSLQKTVDLGPEVGVMPAHRLFNQNKFNFESVRRAEEIIQHHARRLGRILAGIGLEPTGLESITRRVFDRRKLTGLNLFAALTEVVAHIELLEDTGDLQVTEEHRLRRTGSENYRQLIRELTT